MPAARSTRQQVRGARLQRAAAPRLSKHRDPRDRDPARMVRTDFAHRWRGDEERAKSFYQEFGVCLAPEDVARMVAFAVQQPPHVVIAQLMVVPISQT